LLRNELLPDCVAVTDEWYAKIYSRRQPGQLCFDATATYSTLPRAALKHMRALSPDAKIIISLREPVARIWSYVRMQLSLRGSFSQEAQDDVLRSHRGFLKHSSDYATIWQNFEAVFGRDNVLVLDYDEIESNPLHVLKVFCNFVSIDYCDSYFKIAKARIFEGPRVDITDKTRLTIEEIISPFRPSYSKLFPNLAARWTQGSAMG
jgi:hypothetical protein